MLQFNFYLQYKIFGTSTKYFELGPNVFDFFLVLFLFLRQTKICFGTVSSSSLFSSSPLYLPSPTIPSLLSQHPSPYSFYLNAYLVSLELQTFGFPLDSCCDALPVSDGDLDTSSPIFLNYIQTVLVTHFLKLFKSDIYIGPSPSLYFLNYI